MFFFAVYLNFVVICGVLKISGDFRVCAPGLVVLLEPDPLLGGGGPEREQGGRERGWKRECPVDYP